jgi:hypothetical protein
MRELFEEEQEALRRNRDLAKKALRRKGKRKRDKEEAEKLVRFGSYWSSWDNGRVTESSLAAMDCYPGDEGFSRVYLEMEETEGYYGPKELDFG